MCSQESSKCPEMIYYRWLFAFHMLFHFGKSW